MSVNPFDPKTVLLARHAQHVVLIHFPIALFLTAVGFDFLAERSKSKPLADAAYFNFLLAAVSVIPAIATGLAAWQWALEGQKLKGVLLLHLIFGSISGVLICCVCGIHRRGRRNGFLPSYRWLVEGLGVALVGLTGHLGGFLSGVNGPG